MAFWEFKSREQEEKEYRRFEKRIFPRGETQRNAMKKMLSLLSLRGDAQTQMMAFICAKDLLLGDIDEPADPEKLLLKAYAAVHRSFAKPTKQESCRILALAQADIAAENDEILDLSLLLQDAQVLETALT
ncbi:MAG: hypothetical protein RSG59_00565 [Ruthenibacterium sp.]